MADEEYEILPHEELQKLREEVEELKRNPMGNVAESEDLKTAMSKLTRAMHHLIDILTTTNDEMVSEFKRTTMSEHFEKISDQNEKIANALINMVELQEQRHPPMQASPAGQSQEPMSALGQDNFAGMQTQGVGQDMSMGQPNPMNQQEMNMQPQSNNSLPGLNIPPPEHHHKKGIGSLFKK